MKVLPGVVVDSLHEEAEIFKPNQPKQIKPCGVGEKEADQRARSESELDLAWTHPMVQSQTFANLSYPQPSAPKTGQTFCLSLLKFSEIMCF